MAGGHDGMKSLVHGGAGQVVHGGINDAKVFLFTGFEVQHLANTNSRVTHQRAARFNHEFFVAKTGGIYFCQQLLPQRISVRWGVVVVVDAQTAPKIDVLQRNTCRFNGADQFQHAVHCLQIRRGVGDLRANVAINTDHFQTRQRYGVLVNAQGILVRHTKFIAFQTG